MNTEKTVFVEAVLLLVAFMWGINPPVMKVGLAYLAPMPYNALRIVIAVALAILFLRRTGNFRPVERADWKHFFAVSFYGFFVFQLFFTFGVQNTTAGNASVMLGLLPVCVAVINRILKIETISRGVLVGIVVSFLGVAVMAFATGKEVSLANRHLVGAVCILFAQSGYGYYTVMSKRLVAKYSAYQVTAYVLGIAGALFVLISIPWLIDVEWSAIPMAGWLSILYSGVFGLCVGNFLWIWGIGKIGSTRTSVFNNLSPLFAITTGYLFLHEPFGWGQLAGTILIFIGLWLTRSGTMKVEGKHDPN